LCKHGFALGHRKRDFTTRCHELSIGVADTGVVARESLDAWRRYIAIANGVQKVVQALHNGHKAPEADWEWLFVGVPKERRDISPSAPGPKRNQSQNPRKRHAPPTQSMELERWMSEPLPPDMTAEARRRLSEVIKFGLEVWRTSPRLSPLRTLQKGDPLAENPSLAAIAASMRDTLKYQKRTLANVLNHWLDECATGFHITWEGPEIETSPGVSDAFARGNRLLISIGVLLLEAVRNHDLYLRCENCHEGYEPERKPRAGESHYCFKPACQAAGNRNRVAKFRNKQRK
jgi:hypothetical protein